MQLLDFHVFIYDMKVCGKNSNSSAELKGYKEYIEIWYQNKESKMSYIKVGVAGPVGSGKTALIEILTRKMADEYSIGVITNDIYTQEDAEFLCKNSVFLNCLVYNRFISRKN